MSVDFGIFANTDFSNSPFQYVIFGKNGGLLEVELNEAQYLGFIRDKIALESIGNRCVNASISRASNGTTTIKGDFIIDGYAIHSCETTISTSVGNDIYVGVSLETLTKDSTITKNGRVGGEVIDNTILDNRMGIETTQRKAIKLELSTTAQDGYVKLAHIASTGTAMFDLDNISISDSILEIEESIVDSNKNHTVNLVNATLEGFTSNGITCTANRNDNLEYDGTYTLTGTASAVVKVAITNSLRLIYGENYKIVGFPLEAKSSGACLSLESGDNNIQDIGDGAVFNFNDDDTTTGVLFITIPSGTTLSDVTIKPMVTTNLNATYSDFVKYTGDYRRLTEDVAELWDGKAPKVSPEFQNDISMNRLEGKTVGGKSTALGSNVTASGDYSHAEGYNTIASGNGSHVEGTKTEARGNSSHAEGLGTVANAHQQSVQGRFNVIDTNNTYAHIIGGGTGDSKRKNIYTLDWSGNAVYAGDVEATDGSNAISLVVTAKHLTSVAFTSASRINSGATTSSALSNVVVNLLFEEAHENACLAYGNIIFNITTSTVLEFSKGDRVYVNVPSTSYSNLVKKYLAMTSKSFSQGKLAFVKENIGNFSVGEIMGAVTLKGSSSQIQVLMTFLKDYSFNPTTVGGTSKQIVLCF